jgi:formate-dependent phosphoribosylglycinamide formyltransferase (GAR transformylase)
MQVAHRSHVFPMTDPERLRAVLLAEKRQRYDLFA